ncbi:dihydroorotase [Sinimarinibacterium sp. CAU 1509]|uniref:dihydroorotase n=1 Tax=Sinimarinibacterium sp. CAU 1509 TaxID=2562283 RepID=UPI0010AD6F6E|nr:dihydroorotase [Sinimarinibacterium sp. CAU 1509]TJY62028.1 dihydroorotase [Sinimarinibacterium sp. CAU 1509]
MLITNAHIINEGHETPADVLIRNGRIERIAPQISAPAGTPVYDAKGQWLLPGLMDDQVHFREPGLTHKGNLFSESRAAVAGGVTSYFDMPNNKPTITTRELLADKYTLAEGHSFANYAFYFGAANDNLEEIAALQPNEACAVKVFMGASTGNMLVDDPHILEGIFARSPLMVVTHCEDTPMIQALEADARAKYGEDVPAWEHPNIRSAAACYASSQLAVGLAKKHNADLHVLHLTTARELALFEPGPMKGKKITVEACVHHLAMSDADYAALGHLIKCNPAIKTEEDRRALIHAVMEDRIDIIATDHAPHTAEEKANSYFKAPSGLPLVQHSLLMLIDLVKRGELNMRTVVQKACHATAERFGVIDRGYVREGYWADLVLVDPHGSTTVDQSNILYKCGWSPLEGRTFGASITGTWVNGELVYENGEVKLPPIGQRIQFASQR